MADQEVPRAPKANYGANENPRGCSKCKSTDSRVYKTTTHHSPLRIVRIRICSKCGQRNQTCEPIGEPYAKPMML